MDNLTKEYKALVRAGWRVFNLSHRAWDKAMNELGLSTATFPVVEMAVQQPGVSQQTIANALSIDKSCVSRSVKYLVENGFLLREKCPERTHGFRCYPTEKGLAAYDRLYELEGTHIRTLFTDIDPAELARANALCAQLIERLSGQTGEGK